MGDFLKKLKDGLDNANIDDIKEGVDRMNMVFKESKNVKNVGSKIEKMEERYDELMESDGVMKKQMDDCLDELKEEDKTLKDAVLVLDIKKEYKNLKEEKRKIIDEFEKKIEFKFTELIISMEKYKNDHGDSNFIKHVLGEKLSDGE